MIAFNGHKRSWGMTARFVHCTDDTRNKSSMIAGTDTDLVCWKPAANLHNANILLRVSLLS